MNRFELLCALCIAALSPATSTVLGPLTVTRHPNCTRISSGTGEGDRDVAGDGWVLADVQRACEELKPFDGMVAERVRLFRKNRRNFKNRSEGG